MQTQVNALKPRRIRPAGEGLPGTAFPRRGIQSTRPGGTCREDHDQRCRAAHPRPCRAPDDAPNDPAPDRRGRPGEQLSLPYEWEVAPGVPAVPPVPSAPPPRRSGRRGRSIPTCRTRAAGPPGWPARSPRSSVGERPPGQLTRWVARDELARLARRGRGSRTSSVGAGPARGLAAADRASRARVPGRSRDRRDVRRPRRRRSGPGRRHPARGRRRPLAGDRRRSSARSRELHADRTSSTVGARRLRRPAGSAGTGAGEPRRRPAGQAVAVPGDAAARREVRMLGRLAVVEHRGHAGVGAVEDGRPLVARPRARTPPASTAVSAGHVRLVVTIRQRLGIQPPGRRRARRRTSLQRARRRRNARRHSA